MRRRDAGDQFGQDHRLAQTGSAEQPGFATAHERRQQIDDLDAGLKQLGAGRKFVDLRRVAMDRPVLRGLDGTALVDRLAQQIEHAAQRRVADGDRDGTARIHAVHPADHPVRAAQRDAADAPAAQVLLDFAGQVQADAFLIGHDPDGIVDGRKFVFGVLRVERRTDDLGDAADVFLCSCCRHSCTLLRRSSALRRRR